MKNRPYFPKFEISCSVDDLCSILIGFVAFAVIVAIVLGVSSVSHEITTHDFVKYCIKIPLGIGVFGGLCILLVDTLCWLVEIVKTQGGKIPHDDSHYDPDDHDWIYQY